MTDREETALAQGQTGEKVWKEYTVELTMDFLAYEGDELAQAEALAALLQTFLSPAGKIYLKYPGTYPSET